MSLAKNHKRLQSLVRSHIQINWYIDTDTFVSGKRLALQKVCMFDYMFVWTDFCFQFRCAVLLFVRIYGCVYFNLIANDTRHSNLEAIHYWWRRRLTTTVIVNIAMCMDGVELGAW